jgi:hypothetical protein
MLAGIDAPHFNCAIVLQDDRVTRAAPIVRYMLGWSRAQVRDYCAKKGWKISVIAQAESESTA